MLYSCLAMMPMAMCIAIIIISAAAVTHEQPHVCSSSVQTTT
jgi:hypothetical protein